jgi:hypothetical protein
VTAAHALSRDGERAQRAADAAGLAPSKTSGFVVSLGPRASLERRVARMRKAIWNAGHWLQRRRGEPAQCWFVLLTYRDVNGWSPRHISGYFRALREWAKERGAVPRYAWVGELQERGALHYHIAIWLPKRLSLPKPDKSGMWPHGWSGRDVAIAPIGYLMKYASKGDTINARGEPVVFPKGARLYGVGGMCEDAKACSRWLTMPEWAKRMHGVGSVRRNAGRLVVQDTGEILVSPYSVEKLRGHLQLRVVGELQPRFHDGMYSTLRAAA